MVIRKIVITGLALGGWLAVAGLLLIKRHPPGAAAPSPGAATAAVTPQPHIAEAPTAPVTAASERDVYLQHLAATGSADKALVDIATAVVNSWRPVGAAQKDHSRFEPVACYRAGCAITLHHPNLASFQRLNDQITRTPEFLRFPGSKWRSGPIMHDKAVETSWILFAPDPPEQATNAPVAPPVPPAAAPGTPG